MKIETNEQVIPQIELDYKKGYDCLTTGVNIHQFVGYNLCSMMWLSLLWGYMHKRVLQKTQRTINFDEPDVPVSTELRLDVQIGFKLGW